MTLTAQHLTYLQNMRPLIQNISLSFQPGILYGILGPNGSGKTTLLKTLSCIWTPHSGSLSWHNQNLLQFTRIELSRLLTLVPQNPTVHFDFTVNQMITMGRYALGTRSQEAKKQIEEAMHQVNVWHLRQQLLGHLSGGERQRVYIGRALATQAPILLLDEPTSHLDLKHQLEIWQLLKQLAANRKTVIVTMHDLFAAKRYCDQLVILKDGCCHATGTYDAIINPKSLKNIFGVCLQANGEFINL